MAKARGLGRGLSALIPEKTPETYSDSERVRPSAVAIELIDPNPFQPRRVFVEGELAELARSIGSHGIIQPVMVRPVGSRFQLVAGERRVRAARMVGLVEIPVVVRELSDRDAMEMALVENVQRTDLNAMEEAEAYRRLVDEFDWTQEELGDRVGKSRSHIANFLRLLQLEEPIQDMLRKQALTLGHGKVLLSVEGPRRLELAEAAAREGWAVRHLQRIAERSSRGAQRGTSVDVHLKAVETGLRRQFGTKVALRGDAKKGRIEIPYRSLEELERILAILKPQEVDPSGFVV